MNFNGMDKRSRDDSEKALNQAKKAKKRKVTVEKESCINLRCEWVECSFFTVDPLKFLEHVESHEPHLEVREVDGNNKSFYCCMWECCGFDSERIRHTRFHINYHAYHTQIKARGNQLLIENPTLDCSLDFAGRNLLPVLPAERQCEWHSCSFVTNSFQRLIDHVFTSHIAKQPCRTWRESATCEWIGCDKQLRSGLTELKVHLKTHTQEKTIGCPVCGAQFASKQKLRDHLMRQLPSSDRNYKCSFCKKQYPSERFLQEHIRLHLNIFKCPFCDMTCALKSSLTKHIYFRHLNDRPFKCNFCDHRSKTEGDMERHYETHCSENVWVCEREGCDFSCRSKNGLTMHYNKAHSEESVAAVYVCHICEKRCNRGFTLTRHLRAEHNYRCAPGQARFRYIKDDNGLYRLQVVRYESVEVTQQVTSLNCDKESRSRAPKKFTCLAIDNDKFVITEDLAANTSCEPAENDDPDDPEEAGLDMVLLVDEDKSAEGDTPLTGDDSTTVNQNLSQEDASEKPENGNPDDAAGDMVLIGEFDDSANINYKYEENIAQDDYSIDATESKLGDMNEGVVNDKSDLDGDSSFEETLQQHLGIKDGTGFVKILKTIQR